MKDTIISARRKKIEVVAFIVCFLIANLLNLYAIIAYNDASYSELITSLGYVTAAAVVLYVLWCALRILFYGTGKLFFPKK